MNRKKFWLTMLTAATLLLPMTSGTRQAYGQAVVVRPGNAGSSLLSTKVIYASKLTGIAGNSNIFTGGGTDDTSILQAALNQASATQAIELVIDGQHLITGLTVKSNTIIRGMPGCGLYLKGGSNQVAVRNANPSASVVTDKNIVVRDLFINGNYSNNQGSSMGAGTYGTASADNNLIVGAGFYGVSNVTLQNVEVYNSPNWGFCLSKADHCNVLDCKQTRGGGQIQMDGLDVRGNSSFIAIRNFYCESYDDAIALNSIHYAGDAKAAGSLVSGEIAGLAYINGGPITDVTVDGVTLKDCLMGVALYSDASYSGAKALDRISVKGIKGTSVYYAIKTDYDNGNTPRRPNGGTGSVGTIHISDVDVRRIADFWGNDLSGTGSAYNFAEYIRVGNNADNMTISDCRFTVKGADTRDYNPAIRVMPNVSVGNLNISGFAETDTYNATVSSPRISVEGTVQNLNITNASWNRVGTSQSGTFLGVSGTVGSLVLRGLTMNNAQYATAVTSSSASVSLVNIAGLTMQSCAGGAALNFASAGALAAPIFNLTAFIGPNKTAGTLPTSLATQGDAYGTAPSGGGGGSGQAGPTGLTVTPAYAYNKLSWTAAAGATSYTITRSTSTGTGYVTVASGVTGTAYTDADLTNGTTYYYVVQAVSGSGTGSSSEANGAPSSSSGVGTTQDWETNTSGFAINGSIARSTTLAHAGTYSLTDTSVGDLGVITSTSTDSVGGNQVVSTWVRNTGGGNEFALMGRCLTATAWSGQTTYTLDFITGNLVDTTSVNVGVAIDKRVGGSYTQIAPGTTPSSRVGRIYFNQTANYVGVWYKLTLSLNGSLITARIYDANQNKWMDNTGTWQTYPCDVVTTSDTSIAAGTASNQYSGLLIYGQANSCFADDFRSN